MYNVGFRKAAIVLYNHFGSLKKTAKALSIAVSTIWRWVTHGLEHKTRLQKTPFQDAIRAIVEAKVKSCPTSTQVDIARAVASVTGCLPSRALVAIVLRKLDFTKKRCRMRGVGRASETKCATFAEAYFQTNRTRIVAIDESGFSYRTMPLYGYGRKGERVVIKTSNCRQRTNLLLAVSCTELVAASTIQHTTKGTDFAGFVRALPLPAQTYLLMDNASIHKTPEVQAVMAD